MKSEKHLGNSSGIVSCFTVIEENCIDPPRQKRKGKTKRDVSFLYFVVFYFIQTNHTYFELFIQNEKLKLQFL